jgi:hypothetical protein
VAKKHHVTPGLVRRIVLEFKTKQEYINDSWKAELNTARLEDAVINAAESFMNEDIPIFRT